MNCDSSISLKF